MINYLRPRITSHILLPCIELLIAVICAQYGYIFASGLMVGLFLGMMVMNIVFDIFIIRLVVVIRSKYDAEIE